MVFHKVVKVGIAFRLEHGEHVATHGVHAVDVRRTLAQEQSDILFFHPVALVEPCHSLVEMIACRHKPVVERVEVVERMFHLGVEVGQLCVLLTELCLSQGELVPLAVEIEEKREHYDKENH